MIRKRSKSQSGFKQNSYYIIIVAIVAVVAIIILVMNSMKVSTPIKKVAIEEIAEIEADRKQALAGQASKRELAKEIRISQVKQKSKNQEGEKYYNSYEEVYCPKFIIIKKSKWAYITKYPEEGGYSNIDVNGREWFASNSIGYKLSLVECSNNAMICQYHDKLNANPKKGDLDQLIITSCKNAEKTEDEKGCLCYK